MRLHIFFNIFQFDGDKAIDLFPAIMPLLRNNVLIRDSFIEMLKKCLHAQNVSTQKMAIHGACQLLKELKYATVSNVSQNRNTTHCFTLTGYSVLNRMTHMNRSRPTMQDVIILEIMNIVSGCLNQGIDIKNTLYSGKSS